MLFIDWCSFGVNCQVVVIEMNKMQKEKKIVPTWNFSQQGLLIILHNWVMSAI